ncbi:MAG: ComEA family DNA-binding protein [Patescibacteria group bacterium]|nr:ComEA family DNA-binding protein [Patescibacteria group bacterium]
MKKTFNRIAKKYIVEIFFILIAIVFLLISFFILIKNNSNPAQENEVIFEEKQKNENENNITIYVDISGSVNKPDLYQIKKGSRLKDIINKAGGLSETADKNFFNRNFNLARVLNDQEKIYIPSIWEVQSGLFLENPQQIQINKIEDQKIENDFSQDLININNATAQELDSLPGIGKITAEKIIRNRPYQSFEDLINKKIVNKSTYEKIKNLISL